jgi:large subunit ribosomal protein L17
MLRDITTDLIINERIVTTEARAKEVRSTVEKMMLNSFCKADSTTIDSSSSRTLATSLRTKVAAWRRAWSYTRILKTEPRRGDAAPMVVIEFVK